MEAAVPAGDDPRRRIRQRSPSGRWGAAARPRAGAHGGSLLLRLAALAAALALAACAPAPSGGARRHDRSAPEGGAGGIAPAPRRAAQDGGEGGSGPSSGSPREGTLDGHAGLHEEPGEPDPAIVAWGKTLEGAPDDRLRHLRALPYVQYDPNADVSLLGVTRHDRERTWPGYNLFTNEATRVLLIDNDGRLVHQWRVTEPYSKCEHAKLLDDGTLLVVCVDLGLVALDWDSNLLWDLAERVHHDVDLAPDGTIIVPSHAKETYLGREVLFERLLRVSPGGRIVGRWSAWENLEELQRHHPPSPLDTPPGTGKDPLRKSLTGLDYHHLNSVEVLPETPLGRRDPRFREGNILVSLRNANVILILDQDDHAVLWSWGPGELDLPHMPTMVPNGNILIFDNGTYRHWSRVIEVEPPGGRIVWEYKGDPLKSFYSRWRGSSQRLPNGNTLICESERGHAIEVTRDKEVVWEFWNSDLRFGARKRIYRLIREPAGKIERLLRAHGAEPPLE